LTERREYELYVRAGSLATPFNGNALAMCNALSTAKKALDAANGVFSYLREHYPMQMDCPVVKILLDFWSRCGIFSKLALNQYEC